MCSVVLNVLVRIYHSGKNNFLQCDKHSCWWQHHCPEHFSNFVWGSCHSVSNFCKLVLHCHMFKILQIYQWILGHTYQKYPWLPWLVFWAPKPGRNCSCMGWLWTKIKNSSLQYENDHPVHNISTNDCICLMYCSWVILMFSFQMINFALQWKMQGKWIAHWC